MMIKLFALVLTIMVITNEIVSAQITFSKDWRAGGKRSGQTLSTHGVSVVDVPCDQLADYQTTKIKDLVRKEAIALLQCEYTNLDKNDEPKK